MRTFLEAVVGAAILAAGCSAGGAAGDGGHGGGNGGTGDGGSFACQPCLTGSDCGSGASCVQYAMSDFCARGCSSNSKCPSGEACLPAVTTQGTQVSVCIPTSSACGQQGCGTCPSGTTCEVATGDCVSTSTPSSSSGTCGNYDGPDTSSCCKSCKAGSSSCQANGCYGGWWCDSSACTCHAPPSNCGSSGSSGSTDGGVFVGPAPTGSVGASGGSVSKLYFAVVGDTRPSSVDDTGGYPTSVITKIYQDIEAMNPRPQFVITTGDYMYASTSGSAAADQMKLYAQARSSYSGIDFPVMGNHECTGYTSGNCSGSSTANLQAFKSTLLAPIGQSQPYFTIPINDVNGAWTAKFVFVACNAWDSTQQSWLQGELAKSTTYTFIARHEPSGTGGMPCTESDATIQAATYDLFLVGHTHTYRHSGKELIEGVGGAPVTGSANYGYATVEQLSSGGFQVTQYDYNSAQAIDTFTIQ